MISIEKFLSIRKERHTAFKSQTIIEDKDMSRFRLQRLPVHPGEILREENFRSLRVSQAEFARKLVVSTFI